jgi:hypothetical protein
MCTIALSHHARKESRAVTKKKLLVTAVSRQLFNKISVPRWWYLFLRYFKILPILIQIWYKIILTLSHKSIFVVPDVLAVASMKDEGEVHLLPDYTSSHP